MSGPVRRRRPNTTLCDDPDGDATTVAFTTELNTPSPGITTVTATVTGTPAGKLFVRVAATQN